jgi:hypothetical protein
MVWPKFSASAVKLFSNQRIEADWSDVCRRIQGVRGLIESGQKQSAKINVLQGENESARNRHYKTVHPADDASPLHSKPVKQYREMNMDSVSVITHGDMQIHRTKLLGCHESPRFYFFARRVRMNTDAS